MFCNLTKSTFSPILPKEITLPQYPSEFFQSRRGKPTLQIPQKDVPMKDLRALVKGGIVAGKLDVKIAIRFAYEFLKDQEGTLNSKWESFGVHLGDAGSKIKIFSMFDIEEIADKRADGSEVQGASEEDDEWMTFWILSQYRMARTPHPDHRGKISTKLTTAATAINPDALAIPSKTGMTQSWVSNVNYTRLVAGVDMFLSMFKQHPMSHMRMGTLPSRYKDCSALLGLSQMADLTNLTAEEIADWIFVGTIGTDLLTLMKSGEEVEKPESYTPYLMDMGLSNKSPYSATQCPNFYNFCHLTCTLMRSTRSKHAKLIHENNISDIYANAQIMAFVLGKTMKIMKVFTKKDTKKQALNPDDFTDVDDTKSADDDFDPSGDVEMPSTRDPTDWFNYLIQCECKVPSEIKNAIQQTAGRLGTTRDGTIGRFIEQSSI
ncbi:nucleoprotein [Inhangapi virus]|uniref:Nucleoprotein n=1 Tax=Inhangapi virus TaxID=1620892 RepID=A0A0D3R128_9RHAB|nr:N [Inhangapi virus] [Inhangapi virus]YP_010796336.1 nucleoprotein [Inhangapi virus]AJR28343.1 nucleoprotein [Inhangapi virus]ALJ94017.1 N [Inhangapi virus] [Inhangapi virus]